MALLQDWRDYAYKFDDRTKEGQQFWLTYFNIEKGIYEKILADKDVICLIKGKPQLQSWQKSLRQIYRCLLDF